MNTKILFKVTYLICRTLFILIIPIGLYSFLYHMAFLFFPNSSFAESFGEFEPTISLLTIEFETQPDIFINTDLKILSFICEISLFILVLGILRIVDKLFKNIYKESLFIMENVKLFYMIGIFILSFGTIFFYTEGLIFDKTIEALHITNASIGFSNLSYIDTIFTGIACLLIGVALKVAVKAVEENKYTI
ncbi:hypothetical protein [Gracilibacillus saliphilus]|uniref:hypothetical protein n=1 Tax=Gracilibacillus saliphilus TaxID=543890 RepID=UPI0013D38611|nr:hypothetical protein [Gracilibacillus saliphilus]